MYESGLMYLVTDDIQYVSMTLMSIKSFRLSGNDNPITVVTNLATEVWTDQGQLEYSIRAIGGCSHSGLRGVFEQKPNLLKITPYYRTLIVDSDILILRSMEDIWLGAEHLSLALDRCATIGITRSACPRWGSPQSWAENIRLVGENAPHYNVGVLRIDNTPGGRTLFDNWKTEVNRFTCPDVEQVAFIRALHRTEISLKVMEQRFNRCYGRVHASLGGCAEPHVVHFYGMNLAERNRAMTRVFGERFGRIP